jgi:phospholipid/cholesterol/gamma-HCH transport system ATP-binding protein
LASEAPARAGEPTAAPTPDAHIVVRAMDLAYGSFVLIRELDFTIRRGDIFVIMGGSGCGKSTLMRQMIGLKRPARGQVLYNGVSFWDAAPEEREELMHGFGVLYQSGALWSSMTLAENIALPLGEYTDLSAAEVREIVSLKLALVGLAGFEDYYPSEISGGMRKRAGLARAMALDPEVLFFDEPSAGLDPISSRRLDDLILELRNSLGATVVMVTHELPSIFTIANNSIFLDPETKSQLATGDPHELLAHPPDPKVETFLTRGGGEQSPRPERATPDGRATSG